ncbi:DNA polymerase I [Saccharibacillus kuerlensis]|uniref:DNA polymerase I n=1 Tax=Saccharibacillus kuerlensis TaxID=459527 RepID=A0ABQ2KUH7_9BACL|nr:DNA polymerase I [Saccharibacillus kuerlensis]GGN91954.1 DNA polymerase I [Saccharibacillus kuerlensis]
MDKLMMIDGNNLIYRAFYGITAPLQTADGRPTNAVYGFMLMLLRLLQDEKPTHILVTFDAGKTTFRHETFGEYKAGRQKTPPELSSQFPLLKELIEALGIKQYELTNYEADDIMGTLAKRADSEKCETVIVSGDQDVLQLASEYVRINLLKGKGVGDVLPHGPEQIKERFGLTPEQIIDLKGLMGDSSDNIPGVPGVGEKTALKLLHEYGSVENLLANTDKLKGKQKERIEENAESARMSKKLATIFCDVPLPIEWNELAYAGADREAAVPVLRKLQFNSLIEKIPYADGGEGAEANDDPFAEPASKAAERPSLDVRIADEESLGELAEFLPNVEVIHAETHGDNPHHAELVGLMLHGGERYYYVSFDLLKSPKASPVLDWLEDPAASKSGYDLHRLDLVLHWHGIRFAGAAFDSQLAAYLIDPTETATNVSGLAVKYELPALTEDDEVYGRGAKFTWPDAETLAAHSARKAEAIEAIIPKQRELLESFEMNRLFFELEMPLSRILADMEKQGIAVNPDDLEALGGEFEIEIKRLQSEIYEHAGMEFNINSTRQLGEILFDKLGLPVKKKTKTGYSTDAKVLEELAPYHEIVRVILQYRQLSKLQSTYIDGLLKEIRPETGKVHTYYRQALTATGRLSSQYPNLQNIPIRLEEGRKIRKAFVPSEPGWTILAADYSQVELRVLAHISDDERLKDAFLNDMDIHTKTAMDVFGVTKDQVDSNMRRSAKAVNFGIVYGISDYGLSQNLGITRKQAAEFIEQYFAVFKGVQQYMHDIVEEAKKDGYVKTLLERRRYLPDIHNRNFAQRSFAERTAMNTPIQGTAADIIKLAMVQVDAVLRERGLKSRMLLQVHDELVFEVPEDELELMKKLLPETMEGALKLSVPLKADVSFGSNWYEAK